MTAYAKGFPREHETLQLSSVIWRGNESRRMLALSIGVGVACGLAAALLITLLNLATQLFFGTAHIGTSHLWVIALPAVGGLLVGPLVTRFAPETRGHGVPEVMLAVDRRQGQMRPRIAVVKTLASAITIGSGGSAGREGPIVQIGAAVGSAVGQVLRQPPEIVRMLVACGSASGIAASFNAPIAGVIFALEVILRDFTARIRNGGCGVRRSLGSDSVSARAEGVLQGANLPAANRVGDDVLRAARSLRGRDCAGVY